MMLQSFPFIRLATVVLCAASAIVGWAKGPEIVAHSVGFEDHYRVGAWVPLRCTIKGGDKPAQAVLTAIAPDSDGLHVQYSTPANKPVSVLPGEVREVELLIRVGQLEAPIKVNLLHDQGRPDSITLSPYRPLDDGGINGGWAATVRHMLQIGDANVGLTALFAEQGSQPLGETYASQVVDLATLPKDWLGYESIDTILVTTGGESALKSMRASDVRIEALTQWVELGGRLVISCGENGATLLGSDGALAGLVPGRFATNATLDEPAPLEEYVGSSTPIGPRGSTQITVAKLADVTGEVLAYAGDDPADLPLVITARRGLGRVTVVTCDLDRSPLREWKGRPLLLRKLLRTADERRQDQSGNYYYEADIDLSDQVRHQLDDRLEKSGVRTTPFLVVAGLVVLYIVLIGPFDYWLVKYVIKRMEATWITFPVIVAATCAGAYALAHFLKGDEQLVHSVEIVDFDSATGLSRGTLWHHFFSPQPQQFDLKLSATDTLGQAIEADTAALSWLGQTGTGLGRMGTTATSATLGQPDYAVSDDRRVLLGRPIQIWSTRSSMARWSANTAGPVEGDLATDDNQVVRGALTNTLDVSLSNARLYYKNWVWKLDELAPGATVTIDESRAPISLETLMREEYSASEALNEYERRRISSRVGIEGLTTLMMLGDALHADRYTALVNRYQHFLDLSHCLDEQTAMVIATCPQQRSQLVDANTGEARPASSSLVVYRVLLPVSRAD